MNHMSYNLHREQRNPYQNYMLFTYSEVGNLCIFCGKNICSLVQCSSNSASSTYVCSKSNSKVARQLYTLPTIWAYDLSPCTLLQYMYLLTRGPTAAAHLPKPGKTLIVQCCSADAPFNQGETVVLGGVLPPMTPLPMALQRVHGLKQAALVLCMHANAHCLKVKMNDKN